MKRRIKRLYAEQPEIPKKILETLIASASLIISSVVAIVSILVKFSTFETVVTTMLSFLCAEYISHSIIEKSKYFKAKREYPLIEQLNSWTEKLYEMNSYCKTILADSHGDQDLFVVTCSRSIDKLYYTLRLAAHEKQIEISSDYIINSEAVFAALNVTNDKVVELTFPIDSLDSGLLQAPEDKKFFETACKMVEYGFVKLIRVLILIGDKVDLSDHRMVALFEFYSRKDGFEGKYISKADFISACNNNMIMSSQLDFGIYGPKMLFRVEQYEPYKGVYTKDVDTVQRYHRLFDEVWTFKSLTHDLPGTTSPDGSHQGEMALSDLFSAIAN